MMHFHKRAAFSPNNKYFAWFSHDEKLLVWDTSNNAFIDCKFDSSVYTTCVSLHWMPLQHKHSSPKKAKLARSRPVEIQLLAVGTIKGDILLYNVNSKNLYLHLVGRHSDAVNDMCFYAETDSFFTCSNDKSIAIWDITSGKQKSKWKAGDYPVSSICVIDGNNMLSSGTAILWWNISEKSVIKTFSGHSAEIFKLLPVNAVSLNSCYFLSAAVSDVKINAWSLNSNECQTPVASFVLTDQPKDMDISKASSKDKPLILSVITEDRVFHLFEHTLNGNVNQPIHPKVSIEINPKSTSPSIMSVTLSIDSESCIIAYGSSKDDMTFKHIKVRELLKENLSRSNTSSNSKCQDMIPIVKERSISDKCVPINGLKSSDTPKKTQIDSVVSNYRRKLRSSSISSLTDQDTINLSDTEDSKSIPKKRNHVKGINIKNPKSSVNMLLKGLQTRNQDIIDAVLHSSDTELISKCVKSLPSKSLKTVLHELNSRLCSHQSHTPTISKWLKEILKVHLNYIIQSQDTVEVLNQMKERVDSFNIHETIKKMSVLKGLLGLQSQNSFSNADDSESEEQKEL